MYVEWFLTRLIYKGNYMGGVIYICIYTSIVVEEFFCCTYLAFASGLWLAEKIRRGPFM